MVAAVPRNVFGIGIECCWSARVEGSWRTGKGEGVLGRIAVGGVRAVWYENFWGPAKRLKIRVFCPHRILRYESAARALPSQSPALRVVVVRCWIWYNAHNNWKGGCMASQVSANFAKPPKSGGRLTAFVLVALCAAADAHAALSAKSYVSEGLIAQWDGLENVSYGGAHDNSTNKWIELTGNGPNLALPSGAAFVDAGLQTIRANGTVVSAANAKKILGAFASANYTAEIAFNKTTATPNSSQGYGKKVCAMLVFGADAYWMGTMDDNQAGMNPNSGGNLYSLLAKNYASPSTTVGRHLLSCSQADTLRTTYFDGDDSLVKTATATPVAAPSTTRGFCFNRAGYYTDHGLDGVYHSIRIYDRALSADEVSVNCAVDKVRYFDVDASTLSLPSGWRFDTADGVKLERLLSVSVKNGVGGTISLNDGADADEGFVWCEQGASVSVKLVAKPETGYVFVGWSGVDGDERYEASTTVSIGRNVQAVFRRTDGSDPYAYSWSGAAGGDWSTASSWLDADGFCGVPIAGDSVTVPKGSSTTLAASSPAYASVTVAGTLVMTNWTTCLSASNVTVSSGGVITCGAAVKQESDLSRVWIVCTNLTVETGGKIDVCSKGYKGGAYGGERGYGPGSGYFPNGTEEGGTAFFYVGSPYMGASPSHGGCGTYFYNATRQRLKAALPYDNPLAPSLPGSGGYSTSWGSGGAGGGAVLVSASGAVAVNGSILADGEDRTDSMRTQPGSGGSVRIVCETISGSGTISATGGDGRSPTENSLAIPASGGCISVEYNTAKQEPSAVSGMKITAAAGVYNSISARSRTADFKDWRDPDPGTLHFSDAKIVDELLGNGLSGQIRGLPSYAREGDVDMAYGHVRFADEGASVSIGGDLVFSGSDVRLEVGGSAIGTNEVIVRVLGGKVPNRLAVGGDLTLGGRSRLDIRAAATNATDMYGAYVTVGGTMTIGTNCSVYAWGDSTTPSSPRFDVGGLNVCTGGLFSAARRGGANSLGNNSVGVSGYAVGPRVPSRGAGRNTVGGGHGGRGGRGKDATSQWGMAYDDEYRPWLPGSGAGGYNDYAVGGRGGGAIIVSAAKGTIRVDGEMNADGEDANWAFNGNTLGMGGAGGTMLLDCGRFVGGETGVLSARGGGHVVPTVDVNIGAGGGGRIAIWCGEPWEEGLKRRRIVMDVVPLSTEEVSESFSYAGSYSVAGGVATGEYAQAKNNGDDGTVWFCFVREKRGLVFILR